MDWFRCFSCSRSTTLLLFCSSLLLIASSNAAVSLSSSSFNFTSTVSFEEAYSHLFGDGNLIRSPDGKNVRLLLDRFSGSGFVSSKMYSHGFFSAMIKLPADHTAGLCVAFYTSNGDVFPKTHDELDFEFLGNVAGKPWRFQTNFYGNGSTGRGREERYQLWFDPTKEFHRYSILWTNDNIVFYVDEVPIREVVRSEAMGGDFPSKPMSLYTTIWDASNWATSGGKAKLNYKYAPFTAEFKDFVLHGCPASPIEELVPSGNDGDCRGTTDSRITDKGLSVVTPDRRQVMLRFRERFMYYSYCYDTLRYHVPLPECVIVPSEQHRFKDTGRLKFGGSSRSPKRRSRQRPEVWNLQDPDM